MDTAYRTFFFPFAILYLTSAQHSIACIASPNISMQSIYGLEVPKSNQFICYFHKQGHSKHFMNDLSKANDYKSCAQPDSLNISNICRLSS